MNTIQLIRFISVFAHENPHCNTVVIGSKDDMTIDEAIEYLAANHLYLEHWQANTTECKNTILIY